MTIAFEAKVVSTFREFSNVEVPPRRGEERSAIRTLMGVEDEALDPRLTSLTFILASIRHLPSASHGCPRGQSNGRVKPHKERWRAST